MARLNGLEVLIFRSNLPEVVEFPATSLRKRLFLSERQRNESFLLKHFHNTTEQVVVPKADGIHPP